MQPRAVLITGAPGSGKTTLGTQLARLLRVPFIARDDIRGGMSFSAGAWTDDLTHLPTSDEAVDAFLASVEHLLARGVSCVIEYVVRSNRTDHLDRILAAGDCVVIVTFCHNAMERLIERNQSDRLIARQAVLRATGHRTVQEHTDAAVVRMRQVERDMLLEFPVPALRVDTTGDYQPNVEAILAFATAIR